MLCSNEKWFLNNNCRSISWISKEVKLVVFCFLVALSDCEAKVIYSHPFSHFILQFIFYIFSSAQFYFISFNCSFQTPSHFDNLFFCEFLRDLFTLLVICAFLGLKSHRIRENWKENRRLGKGKRKAKSSKNYKHRVERVLLC